MQTNYYGNRFRLGIWDINNRNCYWYLHCNSNREQIMKKLKRFLKHLKTKWKDFVKNHIIDEVPSHWDI
jgi:aryl-alcohol dehydrogenase-like predicted oxidoreductase